MQKELEKFNDENAKLRRRLINVMHTVKVQKQTGNVQSNLMSNSLLMRKQSIGNMTLQESYIQCSPKKDLEP